MNPTVDVLLHATKFPGVAATVGCWNSPTHLFPFQDPTVTAEFEAFESLVYASLA